MGGQEVDALRAARAALRAAEQRVGVVSREEVIDASLEPVSAPVADLLPDRSFPTGAASVVSGSTSLLLDLLATAQRAGWVAFVGMRTLGLLAAHDAGVELSRVAYVPDAGGQGSAAIAALLDGIEHVVVGPACTLTDAERRRLLARARERDAALISTTPWPGAALHIDVRSVKWSGSELGNHWLRETHYDVVRHTKADGPGRPFAIDRTRDGVLMLRAAPERRQLRLIAGAA